MFRVSLQAVRHILSSIRRGLILMLACMTRTYIVMYSLVSYGGAVVLCVELYRVS